MRCREFFTLRGGGLRKRQPKAASLRVLPGNRVSNVFEGISRPAFPTPGSLKTSTRHAMETVEKSDHRHRWLLRARRAASWKCRKPSIGTSPARKGAKLVRAAARARSSSSAVEIGECNEESDPGVVFAFDIAVADRLGARCTPSCLLLRQRWANLNVGHSVPQR